ncbi:unnamed protein product [Mytilus edulis]|uniref:C2H2-type domain-containing protein n=1 Tax=Mytilus edulis TaxID=6550 RepID=A0A8S3QMF7_MYTED|nr:unnamed protein product [Mytilus edulis]
MLRHVKEKHAKTYEYWNCPEAGCSTQFIRREYLFRHLINTHKIEECSARVKAINSSRVDENNNNNTDKCDDDSINSEMVAIDIQYDSINSEMVDNQSQSDDIIIISDVEENTENGMEHFIGMTKEQTRVRSSSTRGNSMKPSEGLCSTINEADRGLCLQIEHQIKEGLCPSIKEADLGGILKVKHQIKEGMCPPDKETVREGVLKVKHQTTEGQVYPVKEACRGGLLKVEHQITEGQVALLKEAGRGNLLRKGI